MTRWMRRGAIALLLCVCLGAAAVVWLMPVLRGQAWYWEYFPQWLQRRPSVYLDIAIDQAKGGALRADRVDWVAVRAHAHEMAKDARTPAETYPAIRYVLEALGDEHSFLIPNAAESGAEPAESGVSAVYPEGVVYHVLLGSAAAAAGVRAGDTIERINGHTPEPNPRPRMRGYLVDVPAQSTMRLRRPGVAVPIDVTLAAGGVDKRWNLPPHGARIGADVGYVEVAGTLGMDRYTERLDAAVRDTDAPSVCGWIVDLRRNEGGNMWVMLRGLRPLVGNDPLGFFVTRGDHRSVWRDAAPREPSAPADHLHHVDPPVAVLTSRITASSGEAVAIAFRGRPETRSFGEPTWGLTTGNSPRRMPDGAVLELTTAAEADRLGRVYDDRIAPDDAVPLDWTKLDTAGDPVIAAALAWLRARPACSPKHEP